MITVNPFTTSIFNRVLGDAMAAAAAVALTVGSAVAAEPVPLTAGALAPAYVGQTVDGADVKLSDYAGKVVVLSYWATWCQYCLKEIPILNGLQKVAGKEQMYVLGVNTEERAVFRKVLKKLEGLDMHFAYDPNGAARRAYGVSGIPHMVIVGRDGRIIQVHRGYDESMLDTIVNEINAALATPAAPALQQGARD